MKAKVEQEVPLLACQAALQVTSTEVKPLEELEILVSEAT